MVFATEDGLAYILRADLHKRPVTWVSTSDVGRISSPMVAHAGRFYVGVEGKGLVCFAGDERP
jgi:hypothetical protein